MSNPLESQNRQLKYMHIIAYISIYLLIGGVVAYTTGTSDVLFAVLCWPIALLQLLLMAIIFVFAALANAGVIG